MNTFLELLFTIGRFLVGLWPLMFLAVLAGVFKHKKGFGTMLRTSVKALMASWGFFALLHLVFYFFKMDTFRLLPAEVNMKAFLCVGLILLPFEIAIILEERHKKIKADTLEEMKSLSASQFEQLVAETYRAQGYKVEIIGAPGDHGIDLIVKTRKRETWLVQCKKYRGKVGEPVIRDFYGVLRASNADAGAVVTTGYITAAARLWAEGKPIFLYDGEDFLKVIQATRIRRSIAIQARKKSTPVQSKSVTEPAPVQDLDTQVVHDLDLDEEDDGLSFMGTAFAAANAGLASAPVVESGPKYEEAPEPIYIAPAPKVQAAPEPVYAAPAPKLQPEPVYAAPSYQSSTYRAEPSVMQDKRPFMNMTFEAPQHVYKSESVVDLDVEEPFVVGVAVAEVAAPTPDTDKRPFMDLEDTPVCPACSIPMLLKTQNRLFFKPKKQYICQNAPSCDETIDVD